MRESGSKRLNPPLWHSRYVHLQVLKRNLEDIIAKYIKGSKVENFVGFGCGDLPYESLIKPYVKNYIGVDVEGNTRA